MFKSKVLVVGVNRWKMEEEKKEGITVFYLPEAPTNEINKRGFFPVKKSFTLEIGAPVLASALPAFFEIDFDLGSSVGNKMELVINSFSKIKEVDLYGSLNNK